jgi:hypothetical protein
MKSEVSVQRYSKFENLLVILVVVVVVVDAR